VADSMFRYGDFLVNDPGNHRIVVINTETNDTIHNDFLDLSPADLSLPFIQKFSVSQNVVTYENPTRCEYVVTRSIQYCDDINYANLEELLLNYSFDILGISGIIIDTNLLDSI